MNKHRKLSAVGEFNLIKLIKSEITCSDSVILGIGDDAAVVGPLSKKKRILLTTDLIIEGVHFTKLTKPWDIGHKAMACNISDIAAMGGMPLYALVSIGVSAQKPLSYVQEIYRGMKGVAQRFHVDIVGGDTNRFTQTIINVALVGEANHTHFITRSGAQEGDLIFVTGPLGRSLQSGRHLKFIPRISESQFLMKYFRPSAMIDISDGLLADLNHICTASQKGAVLYSEKIPKCAHANLAQAMTDGEDFELLFSLSAQKAKKLLNLKSIEYKFYHIGEVTKSKGICMIDRCHQIKKIKPKGFTHF